jgi:hypothetical protein
MRQVQTTLHVTQEAKLSLPVAVELETADSLVVNGERVYSVGLVSNKALIPRDTGSVLEKLRYRFFGGDTADSGAILSPWACREEFLRVSARLRECGAGISLKRLDRGKAASMVSVRPKDNPAHSWALGLHGAGGSFTMTKAQTDEQEVRPLSPIEMALDTECSAWRALLRDALRLDYSGWKRLTANHPAAWVNELLTPLPLTIETRKGAPTARVVCQSFLDVLIVTTQLDGIRGLRQRVCKADGCCNLFPVGNYDHKIYCDYECAHRQAVRDGRRRKREASERAKDKSQRRATKAREAK